jgi:hypothetical protein
MRKHGKLKPTAKGSSFEMREENSPAANRADRLERDRRHDAKTAGKNRRQC